MTVENLITPPGRIVWGHPMKSKDKINFTTKQPVLDGEGNKVQEWSFGLAIPKAEFEAKVWPSMAQEAATAYPNGQPPKFSWKYTDGDSIDDKGKPYSERDGYAGCYVLTIKTEAFCPSVWRWDQTLNNGKGDYTPVQEHEIDCGDFVCVNLNIKVHTNNSGGLYMNPNGVEFIGYGKKIVSTGANPQELFGGNQYQLPPGASATPLSSAPANAQMPQGGMPGNVPNAQNVQTHSPANVPSDVGHANGVTPSPSDNTQLPPPAGNFVANATGMPQAGNGIPNAQNAGGYQQPAQQPQAGVGAAQPATTSHTNGMPGIPGAR